ncbi:MAG: HIT family protein [Candidatus Levybacteria bacterium]|nr:HIT family protein [Candidatus Levybacteria bacterium]
MALYRIWDPQGKYKDGFLKTYKYWILEISFRQHTLGSFIIFAKRKIERISELENAELIELGEVMKEIEDVVKKQFRADRFNYLQLGNALHHLHFHGIPRYASSRKFGGRIWIDKSYGHPPVWKKTETNKKLVIKIKEEIQKKLR